MAQTICEQASEQIADAAHKTSRAACAVADALGDGAEAARHAAKQSCDAAAELFYDAKKRVQQHPVETVLATFAAGIASGAIISWIARRKRL